MGVTKNELLETIEQCKKVCSSPFVPDEQKEKIILFLETALNDYGQLNPLLELLTEAEQTHKKGVHDLLSADAELMKMVDDLKTVDVRLTKEQKEFNKKTDVLQNTFGNPVSPFEFYRDMFPVGSFERRGQTDDEKPNGIAMAIRDGKPNFTQLIFDDLSDIQTMSAEHDFVITSPVGYIGKTRESKNARLIYGICVDLDGVGEKQLNDLLFQIQNKILPTPTYIANSGHGVHLYFLFENPIKAYRNTVADMHKLKFGLIDEIWNNYTSTEKQKQKQGLFQGFRIVGSPSKLGRDYPVMAYQVGEKITVEYLNGFVTSEYALQEYSEKSEYTLKECAEMFPEWYQRRIVEGLPPKTWKINRAVYDNWKNRIAKEIKTGHRYFGIMTLAIYARKCDVCFDELQSDALDLMTLFDGLSTTDRFTLDDVKSALKAYNVPEYVRMKKETITALTSIQIKTNRRNGRKQNEHLEEARAIRDIRMKRQGRTWRNNDGRPNAQKKVQAWQRKNPNGTKAQCNRETKIDPKTIRKWWLPTN